MGKHKALIIASTMLVSASITSPALAQSESELHGKACTLLCLFEKVDETSTTVNVNKDIGEKFSGIQRTREHYNMCLKQKNVRANIKILKDALDKDELGPHKSLIANLDTRIKGCVVWAFDFDEKSPKSLEDLESDCSDNCS